MSEPPSSTNSGSEPFTIAASDPAVNHSQSVQSLADRYANIAANTTIQFDSKHNIRIIIPNQNCTEADMVAFAKSIIHTIEKRAFISVACRDQLSPSDSVDPDTVARSRFTQDESAMYTDWENGVPIGHWDFDKKILNHPINPTKVKKFKLTGLALGQLYKIPPVTPQQARAWVENNQALMPILSARVKILKARRDAAGGQGDLNTHQLKERRVCVRILDLMRKKRKEWSRNWDTITALMRNAEHLLQNRLANIASVHNVRKIKQIPHQHKQSQNSFTHFQSSQKFPSILHEHCDQQTSPPRSAHFIQTPHPNQELPGPKRRRIAKRNPDTATPSI